MRTFKLAIALLTSLGFLGCEPNKAYRPEHSGNHLGKAEAPEDLGKSLAPSTPSSSSAPSKQPIPVDCSVEPLPAVLNLSEEKLQEIKFMSYLSKEGKVPCMEEMLKNKRIDVNKRLTTVTGDQKFSWNFPLHFMIHVDNPLAKRTSKLQESEAEKSDWLKMFKTLLKYGADPNKDDDRGGPLLYSISTYRTVIDYIARNGVVYSNLEGEYIYLALDALIENEVVKVDINADMGNLWGTRSTTFDLIVYLGLRDEDWGGSSRRMVRKAIDRLLSAGYKIKHPSEHNYRYNIHDAIEKLLDSRDLKSVTFLLERGVMMNSKSSWLMNQLLKIVFFDEAQETFLIEKFLNDGAGLDDEKTLSLLIKKDAYPRFIDKFLARGVKDNFGAALRVALLKKDLPLARKLLAVFVPGANQSKYVVDGVPLLGLALDSRDFGILDYLLKEGLNPHVPKCSGCETVHEAALKVNAQIRDLFVESERERQRNQEVRKQGRRIWHALSGVTSMAFWRDYDGRYYASSSKPRRTGFNHYQALVEHMHGKLQWTESEILGFTDFTRGWGQCETMLRVDGKLVYFDGPCAAGLVTLDMIPASKNANQMDDVVTIKEEYGGVIRFCKSDMAGDPPACVTLSPWHLVAKDLVFEDPSCVSRSSYQCKYKSGRGGLVRAR